MAKWQEPAFDKGFYHFRGGKKWQKSGKKPANQSKKRRAVKAAPLFFLADRHQKKDERRQQAHVEEDHETTLFVHDGFELFHSLRDLVNLPAWVTHGDLLAKSRTSRERR